MELTLAEARELEKLTQDIVANLQSIQHYVNDQGIDVNRLEGQTNQIVRNMEVINEG